MHIYRLVYISDRLPELNDAQLRDVIDQSSGRNESLGISGLLLSSEKYFIQVLEGEAMRVKTLYNKIAGDPRHCNVESLSEQMVSQRMFPEWGMEVANADQTVSLDRDRIRNTLIRIRLMNKVDQSQAALSLLSEFRNQLMAKAA